MKNTTYMALGFLGIITLWMVSGLWANNAEPINDPDLMTDKSLMKVTVLPMTAQQVNREVLLQGELEPNQSVTMIARTDSTIAAIIRDKGTRVAKGEALMQLAIEDRDQRLASAKAAIEAAQLELKAATSMRNKGLQSDNQVKTLQANLAEAKARLASVELEISNLSINAPFDGVVDARHLDVGSRVREGDQLLTVIDESIIKAVGFVPQQTVSKLQLGQAVTVTLLDGREASGKLTFIARVGDQQTHSFRIEAEVANQSGLLNAGTSAQFRITTGEEFAHFISPSVFALDDSGEVGVKTVGADNRVEFFPVNIIRTEANGFWVSGLPDTAQVITLGQGFVVSGEQVTPVQTK
ncbi:MAG: efflux RND transporter periplasmic adaptor subunit [Kangiellaceae bacterium]|jgi:multidrug efflux system membrane fusion protein|nr:efflux RND transporter periplasmic adaptor subunit [Kangiellaceae bacterium]